MECDSVHLNIEENLKNKEIYLPSQYYSITKEARVKLFPYRSHYLTHSFFRNYSKPETMVYSSIRPGHVAGDATVHDLKAICINLTEELRQRSTSQKATKNFQGDPRRM